MRFGYISALLALLAVTCFAQDQGFSPNTPPGAKEAQRIHDLKLQAAREQYQNAVQAADDQYAAALGNAPQRHESNPPLRLDRDDRDDHRAGFIAAAAWGVDNRWADVTDKLRDHVHDRYLDLGRVAYNEFPDVAYGTFKDLVITLQPGDVPTRLVIHELPNEERFEPIAIDARRPR
jgi:hypothetical protein